MLGFLSRAGADELRGQRRRCQSGCRVWPLPIVDIFAIQQAEVARPAHLRHWKEDHKERRLLLQAEIEEEGRQGGA
jgi:hypothetical protein